MSKKLGTARMDTKFQPLDGGWAWMVMLGMGIVFALCMGYAKAYTLLYQAMLVQFQDSDVNTSIVMTVTYAGLFFAGKTKFKCINKLNNYLGVK